MSGISFKTPSVPTVIRQIRHPQYKNIYEYDLDNQNLWGTETLLGDWNGQYLLIAKDFYPASYIEAAIQDQIPQPYRHNPKAPTNRNLIKTLAHFSQYEPGTTNTDCGFLYTSACFLLRADGEIRGKLPDEAEVMELSYPVLKFTVDNMPNLSNVVLMGKEAARAVEQTPLLSDLRSRDIQVHRVSHPSRAMTDADRFAEWETVFDGSTTNDVNIHSVKIADPTPQPQSPIKQGASMSKRDLVLECLSKTPQSATNIGIRTGLSVKEVRNAIDSLRNKYSVWVDEIAKGFWIDDPISAAHGSRSWKRRAGTARLK